MINCFRRTSIYLALLIAWGQSQAGPPADSLSNWSEVLASYEQFFQDCLASESVPGAALAIVKDGEIAFLRAYGVKKFGSPEVVTINTVFRVASVSKGFAAVLAGMLVDRGLLRWDDRVVDFVPSFALSNSRYTRALTVRHLLSHTSGLPPHAYTNLIEDGVPYKEMLARLRTVPMAYQPGQYFSYQNLAYSLIGDVIAAATSSTYAEQLATEIFAPLGMVNASTGKAAFERNPDHAWPHIRRDTTLVPVTVDGAYYSVLPAAGVNASIYDMAMWLKALLGGAPQIIPPAVLREVQRPEVVTAKRRRYFGAWSHLRKSQYGLGWRVFNYGGTQLIYHGGHVEGFRAEIAYAPAHNVGLVALFNSSCDLARFCVPAFFDLFFGLNGSY